MFTKNPNPIPVYNEAGRVVGGIYGDVLLKKAHRRHMLKNPAAWAWDAHILDTAIWFGAGFTEIECDGRILAGILLGGWHEIASGCGV